jgi:phage gpG-like protein
MSGMADSLISAEINDSQLAAMNLRLERFSRSLSDMTPANREASIALYGWTIRNFDAQGGRQGGWTPLQPRTVKEKARIGKEKMLVRTGALRAAFTQFYSKDNAGVGNELEYSKFHHEGAAHLPQRELLPRRDVVLDIGLKVYGQYIARQVARANS